MKKWIAYCLIVTTLLGNVLFIAQSAQAEAQPRAEGASAKEQDHQIKLPTTDPLVKTQTQIAPQPQTQTLVAPHAQIQTQAVTQSASTAPTNLIANPSLETANGTTPVGWHTDKWSNNDGTFSYPVTGLNAGKAAQVKITTYTDGDAKWYFDPVPVTVGDTYQFSDYSLSTASTELDIQFTMNDNSNTYKYLTTVAPHSSFTQTVQTFTIPANVKSMTVFHVIDSVGTLAVDEYSLTDTTSATPPPPPPPPPTPVPPPAPGNFIPNSNFETAGTGGNPLNWNQDHWGTNSPTFTYSNIGVGGSKAAKVTLSSYSSGDAKWFFDPVSLSPGNYTYTDQFQSSVASDLTVQFQNTDGSFTYKDIGTFAASPNGFTTATANFSVGSNISKVTVFHLIQAVGYLTIDNTGITQSAGPTGIFKTGAVTLTFDDGWLSQYQNAVPKLNSSGLKATFYIVSRQLKDNGFSGFMTKAQVKSLYTSGNEIGAHTQTHPDLPTLTPAQQQTEIQGSRQDLLAMNVGPITTFAYPYGDYDATSLQLVKDAGFSAARSTNDGYAVGTSDKFQLPRLPVDVTTTVAQVKQEIDAALANKQWLILVIHEVNTSGNQYSVTPAHFNQIVDYLVSKQAPVVTIAQGIQSVQ